MNASPLASFRPNFDTPWRGAPPLEPVAKTTVRLRSNKKPWSPSSISPSKTIAAAARTTTKRVTFALPPRPKSSASRSRHREKKPHRRNSRNSNQSPHMQQRRHRKKKSNNSASQKRVLPTHLRLRQQRQQSTSIQSNTIAPYWIADQGPSSPTSLHPDEYQATQYSSTSLQQAIDAQPKRRHKILGHEMIDAAMRGELTKVRVAIEIDGVNPDHVDGDLWGDTALMRAAEHGQLHVVKYLALNANANCDQRSNNSCDDALGLAVKFKRHHIVAFLTGFMSWQRKAASSTYLTRRSAMNLAPAAVSLPPTLLLKL